MVYTASIFDTIKPVDLGLPVKFSSFRLPQRQALDWLMDSYLCTAPVSAACLPTGVGKTSLAVAFAKLLGVKAVYLVATKALQQQVLADFASIGMKDIRGRANYKCDIYGNCDEGAENECSRAKTDACPYTRAAVEASHSDLVVTNYAYWLYSHQYGSASSTFEGVELLICDEAHALEGQLTSFASVKLYKSELPKGTSWSPYGNMASYEDGGLHEFEADTWRRWSQTKLYVIGDSDKDDKDPLSARLKRVLKMGRNYVWQFDDRGHVTFEPIRVSNFTRSLFAGVPRVLLMSASLSEFTLKLLMPSDGSVSYDYRSWPQVFPPQHSPVYHIPTRKLSWRSTDEDYSAVIEVADRIIDQRHDRKGIVHTVSYARTERILKHSRHSRRFIWNKDGGGLGKSLELFRQSREGILVTPSVEEGFDFPGAEAEFQIVLKFPFPNETQRVIKERCRQIPGYRLHYAAQKITQMRGRAVRSADDRAELFILDNAVKQLCGPEGRSYMPSGFRIFTVAAVPPAPPRIVS